MNIQQTKKTKEKIIVIPVWQDSQNSAKELAAVYAKDESVFLPCVHGGVSGAYMETVFGYGPKKSSVEAILYVGLGKAEEWNAVKMHRVFGRVATAMQEKKYTTFAVDVSPLSAVEGNLLSVVYDVSVALVSGAYSFDDFLKKDRRTVKITSVDLLGVTAEPDAQMYISNGIKVGEAMNDMKELGNTPPTQMTPAVLAEAAISLSKKYKKIETRVLERSDMQKLGMGCLLGVSRGSSVPPKFIIMEYAGAPKTEQPIVLVGKGITYDSGGISLKPGQYLPHMKFDMLGAGTVIAVMQAAAALGIKKHIVGLISSCENMPGGEAFRPDDILVAMDGTTIEIGNTDAEGRLVLADALSYAKKMYKPKEIVDFATLTGACMVALGIDRSGLFSNDDALADSILRSAQTSGEKLWRLPLGEEYTETMKGIVADLTNDGHGEGNRYGGASTAAAFLEHFVGKTPWAHFDLSSCYYTGKGRPWSRHGANGFGVKTMIEYLRNA